MTFAIECSDIPSKKRFIFQIFAALSGCLFAVSDGMTYAWTSPMVPYLISNESHIPTTHDEAEWLEPCFLYGSLFGLPLTLFSVNRFGRKYSLIIACIAILIAWLLIGLGNNMIYLFAARFISGMASDMAYVACPMYITEFSDEKIRGFLSGIIMIMDHTGSLIIYCLGPFTPYYSVPILGFIIVLIELAVLLFCIPESPYYLLEQGRIEDAKKSLKYFKSYKDTDKEVKELKEMLEEKISQNSSFKSIYSSRCNKISLLIITVINLTPQLLGYSAIVMNLQLILDSAGTIYMHSSHAAILYGGIMWIAVIFCAITVDRFGRRLLIMISSTVSGVCVLILAIYFHLQYLEFDIISVSWVPLVAVMVFALFFKMGIGIVPMIVTSEISPCNIKTFGVAWGDGIMILGSTAAIQIYQFVTKVSGMYLPFYIYFSWSAILTLFTLFFIPETKGQSLENIQRLLNGDGLIDETDISKDNELGAGFDKKRKFSIVESVYTRRNSLSLNSVNLSSSD